MKTIRIRRLTWQNGIVGKLIVIYLLIMSGSVLQHHAMVLLQKINIFVAAAAFLEQWLKKGATLTIQKNCLDIFMMLSAISLAIVAVTWVDFAGISGYVGNFCLLLTSYCISQRDDFEQIKEDFINTILFLAIVSLILYWGQNITGKLPYVSLSKGNYKFYFLYAQFTKNYIPVLNRNIGIFWEPGMYQGFLIFTMLLIALDDKKDKNEFLKQVLLGITVLSTQSTTGLLLIPFVVFVYLMKRLGAFSVALQYGVIVVVLLAFFALLILPGSLDLILRLFPSEVGEKLMNTDNISRNTRFYNLVIDGTIILQNPLGVPNAQLTEMRRSIGDSLFVKMDNSTTLSSLAMAEIYGIIPGILYAYVIMKGCMNMSANKFVAALVFVIFMVIINTEPHFLCLLLNVFIFHYASRAGNERKENESIVAY